MDPSGGGGGAPGKKALDSADGGGGAPGARAMDSAAGGGGGGDGTPVESLDSLPKVTPSLGGAAAAAATAPSSPTNKEGRILLRYTVTQIEEYVAGKQCGELETYLKNLIVGNQKDARVECVMNHASLFIHCRRGQTIQILDDKGQEASQAYYEREIVPLGHSSSPYVAHSALKQEIDRIAAGINNNILVQPANLVSIIDDYFRLYFPNIASGGGEKLPSALWQFSIKVYIEDKMSRNQKKRKPAFRCLACGKVFPNSTISIMRDHFQEKGNCAICPNLTQNILDRLGVPVKPKPPSPHCAVLKEAAPVPRCASTRLAMAQSALVHLKAACYGSLKTNISRQKLQENLVMTGDLIESLIGSLKGPEDGGSSQPIDLMCSVTNAAVQEPPGGLIGSDNAMPATDQLNEAYVQPPPGGLIGSDNALPQHERAAAYQLQQVRNVAYAPHSVPTLYEQDSNDNLQSYHGMASFGDDLSLPFRDIGGSQQLAAYHLHQQGSFDPSLPISGLGNNQQLQSHEKNSFDPFDFLNLDQYEATEKAKNQNQ